MKEVILFLVLVLGGTGSVIAFLGGGENRNIGFNNGQCPKGDAVCGFTWNDQFTMLQDYVIIGAIVTSPIWIMMTLCIWEKRNEKDS